MTLILDGRVLRDKIRESLKAEIQKLNANPSLVIIQVGSLEESTAYINQKIKFGEKAGFRVYLIKFDSDIEGEEVISKIKELNKDGNVNGIIVQLPIAERLDSNNIIESIAPEKDVDGLTSKNIKALFAGENDFLMPATAKGVLSLLSFYKIPLKGKRVVVLGRSNLVGKPIALSLLSQDATVTVCHSKTDNLKEETKRAEIIISAIGVPKFIDQSFVSEGQVIIDVGINLLNGKGLQEEVSGRKFVGDVDFEDVSKIVKAISPVPGGVGPMTVASLFENLLQAYKGQ